LLFDERAVKITRERDHILGVASGTLSTFPQQNTFLGLPLELSREEVALLCERERAVVYQDEVQINITNEYPLFSYINNHGYYISPGLRFGCKYMVYPGDPLRYHSHFLATELEWDEKRPMLDLVAGGRLATGVRKGGMIGGKKENVVRVFTIEWAGFG